MAAKGKQALDDRGLIRHQEPDRTPVLSATEAGTGQDSSSQGGQ